MFRLPAGDLEVAAEGICDFVVSNGEEEVSDRGGVLRAVRRSWTGR